MYGKVCPFGFPLTGWRGPGSVLCPGPFRKQSGRFSIAHRDKVGPGEVPDDAGGSADSHVADEREEPSEEEFRRVLTMIYASCAGHTNIWAC